MNWKLAVSFLFCISIVLSCQKNWHVADTTYTSYRMTKNSPLADAEVDSLIAPYRNSLSAEMDEIIGYASMDLEKNKPESTLGNWTADLLKEEAEILLKSGIDFAIQNYGGLRISSVSKGPITKGKIYELMPFDNQLIVVHVPHAEMILLLDKIADYGGWPVSDGLQMKIENGRAVNVKISGQALDNHKVFLVAMPDYIANGGDNCFFLSPLKRDEFGVTIRDAMINNIRAKNEKGIQISARIMDRIN